MSFRRYPAYKDSGVEWLGEVPSHWEVLALKRVIQMRSGDAITSEQIAESGDFPVFGGNGIRGFCADFTHDGTYALVGRQGALCGNVNYASGRFWASEHAVVCSPLRTLETRWLGELLRAMNLGQYSVAAAQPGLSVDVISRLGVAVPPLAEQKGIAAFLNRETEKIDALVAEQERLIELLREKRQAVISHAVTKGLNPGAPMKDSGVEWLGEVPAHWQIGRLANVAERLQTGPFGSQLHANDYVTDGIPLVNPSNIRNRGIVADPEVSVSAQTAERLSAYRMRAKDIVIGRRGEMGRCAVIGDVESGWLCGTGALFLTLKARQVPEFFATFLRCPPSVAQLTNDSVGSTMDNLSEGILSRLLVPIPPTEEQTEIVAWVERFNSEADALISEAQRAIELLRERRAALISAAVTGQIDVRHLAAGDRV